MNENMRFDDDNDALAEEERSQLKLWTKNDDKQHQ